MGNTAKKKPPPIDLSDLPELTPEQLARMRPRSSKARPVAYTLGELRARYERTQVEVAKASGIPQGEVSKIESREDLDVITIATLRKYVRALGGDLELTATFPTGHRFVLRTKHRGK